MSAMPSEQIKGLIENRVKELKEEAAQYLKEAQAGDYLRFYAESRKSEAAHELEKILARIRGWESTE